jgi:hypothetical protein
MPNTAPIVLNNGTADVTFSPDSASSTHVRLQDLTQGVLAQRQSLHFDRPSSESTTVRRSIRVNLPYVVTAADGTETIEQVSFKGELVAPTTSPKAIRTQVRELGAAALNSATAEAVLDNPEWFW